MLKRNFNYNVGNIDYNLDGTRLVCKVAGTTGTDPLTIPSEAIEVIDGTVTWSLLDDGGADLIAEMSAPSSVVIVVDSALSPTAKFYTVSANGYIVISASALSAPNTLYVRAFCNVRKYGIFLSFSGADNQMSSIMPVNKGDIIEYDSSSSSYFKFAHIKFIYSVASAKELGLI